MKKWIPLRYERTEFGKQIRYDYEHHNIYLPRNAMRKIGLRDDGISNTISTVQKDYLLLEIEYD